jgi:hypothetical protein
MYELENEKFDYWKGMECKEVKMKGPKQQQNTAKENARKKIVKE